MGVFARGPRREEQPGVGSGLEVDLDLRACPTCRRELHPWEATCPADGSTAVARTDLERADLPPPPAHLLGASDREDPSPQSDEARAEGGEDESDGLR